MSEAPSAEDYLLEQIEWELMTHKYRYFELGLPTLTDHGYDELERRYYDRLKLYNRPKSEAFHGYPIGFSYDHPMANDIVKSVGA